MKEEFLKQVNLCWLYCPDEIIHKSYGFLDSVRTGAQLSDEEREKALRQFVLGARTDMLARGWWWQNRTKLIAEDFRILSSR